MPLPLVWWAAAGLAMRWDAVAGLAGILTAVNDFLAQPFPVYYTPQTPRYLLLGTALYAVIAIVVTSDQKNTRPGEEHGSARWGSVFTLNRKYVDKAGPNLLLTRHFRIGVDGYKHKHNTNILVVGGSGAGKTRTYAVPNVLEAARAGPGGKGYSLVITDPKGEIYEFKFVDKETGEEIAGVAPITGMARYGAQVTQNALAISGYALAEGEPNSKAIVIQKEDGPTAEKNVAIFYYVKSTASLTITKSTSGSNYCGEPFLFHISGDGVDLDVLVPGNGSVTIDGLQVGATYTVTEDESWAWRYSVTGETLVTIETSGSAVTFTNTIDNDKWFDHTTSAENQWSNGEVSQVAKSENE